MTLNEAIIHAEEAYERLKDECVDCANEHKQLAEWLKDYKEIKFKQLVDMTSIDFDSLLKNIEVEYRDPQPLKESDIQALVFKYLEDRDLDSHPSLSGIKAKSWGQIRFMKSQGIRKGHPDLMIEEPAGKYQILYLELKKIGGKLDEYQIAWLKRHIAKGHACSVSYGYYDAIYKIEKYLQGEPIIWEEK